MQSVVQNDFVKKSENRIQLLVRPQMIVLLSILDPAN